MVIWGNLDFFDMNLVKWGLEFEGKKMDVPAVRKILILDGTERVFGPLSFPAAWDERREACANLYEAARILSPLSEEGTVVFIAPAWELTKENGSFLSFLKNRPFIRCIAVHPENRVYPAGLHQAIWEGTLLPCPSNISLEEAVRRAAASRQNRVFERARTPSASTAVRISPEELEALFNPE